MSAGSEGSLRAVLYALAANGGIAVTKFVAAAITGSGSMLAEAIHSLADCTNQVLLLLGMRRARAAPDAQHPMGYGRVVYYYAMLVATLLFFVGGLFSLYEGWHRLQAPQPVQQPLVALAVLGVALVLESFSLWGALREIAKVRRGRSLLRWFRETRQSELLVVAGEDIAALAGLAFAFVAVSLALLTGNPLWDALGSLAVGALLIVVALAVTFEVKAMITGESADPETHAAIHAHITAQPEVQQILHLITLQWGEQIMVAVQAEMAPQPSGDALVAAINRVEDSLQLLFPQVAWLFFEPDFPRR